MEAQFSLLRRVKMQLTTENLRLVQIFNHARLARAFEQPNSLNQTILLFKYTIYAKKNDSLQQKIP